MMNLWLRSSTVFALFIGLLWMMPSSRIWAQEKPPKTFDEWIGQREDALVFAQGRANLDRRSTTRQNEATTASSNTTSLLDRSSASEFLGVALNLAGLSGQFSDRSNDDDNADSIAATSTAYAFYALAIGQSPLNPKLYCEPISRQLRNLSFTVGYDNQKDQEVKGASDNTTSIGLKYLFINKRDACAFDIPAFRELAVSAAQARSNIVLAAQAYLCENVEKKGGGSCTTEELKSFLTSKLLQESTFAELYSQLTDAHRDAIDTIVLSRVEPLVKLSEAAVGAVQRVNTGRQAAFMVSAKLADRGTDKYNAMLILDYGPHSLIGLTANLGFDYLDIPNGNNSYGGILAGQIIYRFGLGEVRQTGVRELFTGRDPVSVSVGVKANLMTDAKPIYQGQVKLKIPITDGIELPISLSFANRTELIDESEVRGQIGFTIDTSRLIAGASSFLPGLR
jgi:hypothetical protein